MTTRQESFESWVEAGEQLLGEAVDVGRHLTIERIAERAGKSVPAFSAYWGKRGGKQGYIRSVLSHMLRIDRFESMAEVHEVLASLTDVDDLVEGLDGFCRLDFRTVCTDSANDVWFLIMGGQPDAFVQRACGQLYGQFDDLLIPIMDKIMDAWDREPSPPFTTKTMAVIFNAIIDGFALRARVDSENNLEDLYVAVVQCLATMTTRKKGTDATITGKVSELNDRGIEMAS